LPLLDDARLARDVVELVGFAQDDDARLVRLGFLDAHRRVGADDDLVADACLARGSTVEADDARPRLALDDVGGEALAVVDVVDLDMLVDEQAGGADQVRVDCQRALIMEVAFGDCGAMQLAAQKRDEQSLGFQLNSGLLRSYPVTCAIQSVRL
jgi:hypothetical protein